MKNLLIYISPDKKFNEENEIYIRIQIENSLEYWDKKDILLVTNFPYEYMGVSSLVVPDKLYSDVSRCCIKINVIVYLLENRLVSDAWFHDTEAWQVAPFRVELKGSIGLTDYGWSRKWNGGSMFIRKQSLDMLRLWQNAIEELKTDDERALMKLTEKNLYNINSEIQRMNITYNVGRRRVRENIAKADKPVKVFHFHPYRDNLLRKFELYLPEKLTNLFYDNRNRK